MCDKRLVYSVKPIIMVIDPGMWSKHRQKHTRRTENTEVDKLVKARSDETRLTNIHVDGRDFQTEVRN